MAKQGGMGQGLYVGGYDLSGDIQQFNEAGGGNNLLPFTDITQYAMARELGQRDGRLSMSTYFDVALGASHPRLSLLPTTDVHLFWGMNQSVGGDGFALISKTPNYDGTRADDGSFIFKVDAVANAYGAEFVTMLSAGSAAVTGAGSLASWDSTASLAFGAQAYLQVTAFTGTDATIVVEDSANNSAFSTVTGLSFTQVTTAHVTERKATTNTATVRRYLRATVSTSAGFSALSFVVGVNKNLTAGFVV